MAAISDSLNVPSPFVSKFELKYDLKAESGKFAELISTLPDGVGVGVGEAAEASVTSIVVLL